MIRSFFFVLACFASLPSFSQTYNVDSSLNALKIQKDSTMRALVHADSAKVEKEFAEKIKWEKVKGVAFYPLLKGSENSGVVPISGLTEIPDPNRQQPGFACQRDKFWPR
jgi:hypothetical protein